VQFGLEVGAFAMLAAMISRWSEVHMAAHQVALQVIHLSFLPGLALGDAASVLVGQAVGARREELVRPVARRALAGAVAYMGACALGLVAGGAAIARAFTTDTEVIMVTARLFVVAAFFQVFDAAYMVARSALRGAGDVRYPAVVCVLVSWASTPPLMVLLGYQMGLGAVGGWIGLCVEICVGAAILWWRLERSAWRSAAARTRAEREAAAAA
jgi:MATE family multidrug resistance protein